VRVRAKTILTAKENLNFETDIAMHFSATPEVSILNAQQKN
jgi:hypothetical protein